MCRTRRNQVMRNRRAASIKRAPEGANLRLVAARLMHPETSGDIMAKRSPLPTINADNLDRAIGYSGSGESKHTRRVSSPGGADPSFNRERQTWTRLDVAIEHQAKCVGRLTRRLMAATDPLEVADVTTRLSQTRTMLSRMRAEQKGLLK